MSLSFFLIVVKVFLDPLIEQRRRRDQNKYSESKMVMVI